MLVVVTYIIQSDSCMLTTLILRYLLRAKRVRSTKILPSVRVGTSCSKNSFIPYRLDNFQCYLSFFSDVYMLRMLFVLIQPHGCYITMKKAFRETQTLRAGCSKFNFLAPPQTPFPGVQDGENLISRRWSLPSPTDPVW